MQRVRSRRQARFQRRRPPVVSKASAPQKTVSARKRGQSGNSGRRWRFVRNVAGARSTIMPLCQQDRSSPWESLLQG